MWMRLPQIPGAALLLLELLLVLGVHTLPLYDAGPHVRHGWGESIRIRRLSTARRNGQESYYLRIHQDGRVDGERHQSSLSVLEIRAVAAGLVAIKGYISSLYLCMASDGTLYGMMSFSPDDCSFREEIRDGYNIYTSPKHGAVVSLGRDKQRPQSRGKGTLSHFLPHIPWGSLDHNQDLGEDDEYQYNKDSHNVESMDPLGLSQKIAAMFLDSH
ncbi:fibroblast growth factor 19 [Engystomops pustulosus]|uniref:fibroblast growth factor 19 n=1 Tax=Engystomops pustulosus TaxID=76066 RepID=UPI003AFA7BEC